MPDIIPLYHGGVETARKSGDLSLWRASHRANIACKDAIEKAIRENFDGSHLNADCAEGVLREFGFQRVNWVLSNTLQQKVWDDRFSKANKEWSRLCYIPGDPSHNLEFVVNSHPAVLNGFVDMVRDAYQKLNLFGSEHCHSNSRAELDYTGKVLVLSPDVLKESYWSPENQLWYAHDGFGCSPDAIGRSIRATCLGDGEMTRWNRADFIGVIDEQYLPDWAAEKLSELQGQGQEQDPPTGGMTMK
jgi:hypothetical protein